MVVLIIIAVIVAIGFAIFRVQNGRSATWSDIGDAARSATAARSERIAAQAEDDEAVARLQRRRDAMREGLSKIGGTQFGDDFVLGWTPYGPDKLPGTLAPLGRQALADVLDCMSPSDTDAGKQGELACADLIAAMFWYRVSVTPHMDEVTIIDGWMEKETYRLYLDNYRKLPPSAEREVAIETIGRVVSGNEMASTIVYLSGLIEMISNARRCGIVPPAPSAGA